MTRYRCIKALPAYTLGRVFESDSTWDPEDWPEFFEPVEEKESYPKYMGMCTIQAHRTENGWIEKLSDLLFIGTDLRIRTLQAKINEIIDKLNSLTDEK